MQKVLQQVLAHQGVKGMRWGYRKGKREAGARVAGASPNNTGGRRLNQVTDDDLRKIVSRMNTEKQYKTLRKEQVAAGKTKTRKLIDEQSQKLVKMLADKATQELAKKIIKEAAKAYAKKHR